jgi:hypothetical protein
MSRAFLRFAVVFFLAAIGSVSAANAQSFDVWFDKKISDMLDAQQVGQNGKGADKQRESPAGDVRSTSLVDQTSATDFVSLALNLAAAGRSASAPASGSQTVTASLYALLAGLNGNAPTDPRFYADHVDARRASFTVGTAASDPGTDNSEAAATIVGGKLLLVNGRELYRRDNLARIRAVQDALSHATAAGAVLKRRIQEILFLALHASDGAGVKADGSIDPLAFATFLLSMSATGFPTVLSTVGPDAMKQIDAEIRNALPVFASLHDAVLHTYDQIQKAAQLAVIYTATVRTAGGFNKHRAAIAYDYGLSPRVTWTANGSVDYVDKKAFGSSTSGRVATEFIGDLTSSGEGWSRAPIRLSFSGEVTWAPAESTTARVQTKLTIPLAMGFDLPIAYQYGKPDTQSANGSEARVGLSVDLSRLMQSAR